MSKQPDPIPSLRAELSGIKETLRRMQSASPFFGTGMHPNGDQGLDSDNYVSGTSGFSLNGGTGVAEFKDIILYDLPNSMLANPVIQTVERVLATNFSLTTTMAEKAGVDITVPADCTRVGVVLLARLYMVNPNSTGGSNGAGGDALYVRAKFGSNYSTATPDGISGSNGFATTVGFDAFNLTGLTPGSTIRLAAEAKTAFASIAANPDDYISAVASLTWLR